MNSLEKKCLAVCLSAAALTAGGHGYNRNETALRVGEDDWAKVTKPIEQHYRNSDETLKSGEECAIIRGSKLILKGGGVTYEHKGALGTECPNGAKIDLTPAQAETQDQKYRAFSTLRQEVKYQVSQMPKSTDNPVEASGKWVNIVNPDSIEQEYANGTETLRYGDSCLAFGKAQSIGQLSTGQVVMSIINPNQFGTECPNGALYLNPAQ